MGLKKSMVFIFMCLLALCLAKENVVISPPTANANQHDIPSVIASPPVIHEDERDISLAAELVFTFCSDVSLASDLNGGVLTIDFSNGETFTESLSITAKGTDYTYGTTLPSAADISTITIESPMDICLDYYSVTVDDSLVIDNSDPLWIGACSPSGSAAGGCECGEQIFSDALIGIGCTADSDVFQATLDAESENFIVEIPVGTTNVTIFLQANGDIDLSLRLQDDSTCLAGWSCTQGIEGALAYQSSIIYFSGDQTDPDPFVEEMVTIDTLEFYDAPLRLWAVNYVVDRSVDLLIYYSYGDNALECNQEYECISCDCGGSNSFCDGSLTEPQCLSNDVVLERAMQQCESGCLNELVIDVPAQPTPEPTAQPTPEPTAQPTPEPTTAQPTPEPTAPACDDTMISCNNGGTPSGIYPICTCDCVYGFHGDHCDDIDVYCIAGTSGNEASYFIVEYVTEGNKGGRTWHSLISLTDLEAGQDFDECYYLSSATDIRITVSDPWYGSVYYYAYPEPDIHYYFWNNDVTQLATDLIYVGIEQEDIVHGENYCISGDWCNLYIDQIITPCECAGIAVNGRGESCDAYRNQLVCYVSVTASCSDAVYASESGDQNLYVSFEACNNVTAFDHVDDPHSLVVTQGGCDMLLQDYYCSQNMTDNVFGNAFFEGDILGDFCIDSCGYYPGQNPNCDECLNGGTNLGMRAQCSCECPERWTGDYCELELCDENALYCEHGGTVGGYGENCFCTCPDLYEGDHCEIHPTECTTEDIACENDGIPIGFAPNCTCLCDSNYDGDLCDHVIPTPCDSDWIDCQHDGVPTGTKPNCTCTCPEGFSGEHCGIHPYVCPDTNDPCGCEQCGWNTRLERCDTESITSCVDCADVCIHGSCANFPNGNTSLVCPDVYIPELECQCDLDCYLRDDCCDDWDVCLWDDNGCVRTSNPCACNDECGWSAETGRCEPDEMTTCDDCPEECIRGTCQTFEGQLFGRDNYCSEVYNPMLICQCDPGCHDVERDDCCEDHLSCFHHGLCPNTTNPCECGYLCGWDSESQSCRYGEETSCAECEHVCEFGDCFTFDDVCPTEYNPFLECQCDVDCHLHDDCCHNERLCPGDNGCPRTDNPCECGEDCGWSSSHERCEPDAVTHCHECEDVCQPGLSCFSFEQVCSREYNPFQRCQCTFDCEENDGTCCADAPFCPTYTHTIELEGFEHFDDESWLLQCNSELQNQYEVSCLSMSPDTLILEIGSESEFYLRNVAQHICENGLVLETFGLYSCVPQCPCLGFEHFPQDIKDEIDCTGINCVLDYDLPSHYGGYCSAWENTGIWFSECHQDSPPDYCAHQWCYVDPTTCNTDNTLSSWLNMENEFSENMYVSYSACSGEDFWTENIDPDGLENCACIPYEDFPQDVKDEIDCDGSYDCILEHDFPSHYGSSCVPWEEIDTWYSDCHQVSSPDFCSQQWCYVDPSTCATDNDLSSYFNMDNGFTENMHYSYSTCGGEYAPSVHGDACDMTDIHCHNGGTPMGNTPNWCRCECSHGFEGDHCEIEIRRNKIFTS